MHEAIKSFTGEYFFLSNFYPCKVKDKEGLEFDSSEAYFQSMKTTDPIIRKQFVGLTPDKSKRLGRKVELRPDWEEIKDDVMMEVLEQKFSQNPDLSKLLIETGDARLIEGNTWGDKYWGQVKGDGKNRLGFLLMLLRDKIKNNQGGTGLC